MEYSNACRDALISVIIPVYNEISTVDAMIGQVKRIHDEAEVVFVDGGSTDGTAERIKENGFRLVRSAKGRGRQLNEGARAAGGSILFFLHCDCEIPDDALDQIREVMARGEYGCFGAKFPSRNFFMWTNRVISNRRAFRRGMPFGDQGVFMTRRLFDEMGGYKDIPLMEDVDLSERMRSRGYMPLRTRSPLVVSIRRYGKGTIGILKTEYFMWNLRRMYRKGADPDQLNRIYGDVRQRSRNGK